MVSFSARDKDIRVTTVIRPREVYGPWSIFSMRRDCPQALRGAPPPAGGGGFRSGGGGPRPRPPRGVCAPLDLSPERGRPPPPPGGPPPRGGGEAKGWGGGAPSQG